MVVCLARYSRGQGPILPVRGARSVVRAGVGVWASFSIIARPPCFPRDDVGCGWPGVQGVGPPSLCALLCCGGLQVVFGRSPSRQWSVRLRRVPPPGAAGASSRPCSSGGSSLASICCCRVYGSPSPGSLLAARPSCGASSATHWSAAGGPCRGAPLRSFSGRRVVAVPSVAACVPPPVVVAVRQLGGRSRRPARTGPRSASPLSPAAGGLVLAPWRRRRPGASPRPSARGFAGRRSSAAVAARAGRFVGPRPSLLALATPRRRDCRPTACSRCVSSCVGVHVCWALV